MKKLFCPFINGECQCACIFNNNYLDEGDCGNCNVNSAILTIMSLGEKGNPIDKVLRLIASEVGSITSNTSDISLIDGKLNDIQRTIESTKS